VATRPGAAPAQQAQLRALAARLAAPQYDNSLDAQQAIWCTDTVNPRDPYAWPRAAAQASADAPHFAAAWTFQSQACATWPATDNDRYLGPFATKTSTPVLLLNNRFDPATPYRGAQKVTDLLQGSRLLTSAGWGHVTIGRSPCIDRYVVRYLVDAVLPPVGATCQPIVQPFAADAAG
jgi:pimeloyl-ACP methyl ester carboxylesterase